MFARSVKHTPILAITRCTLPTVAARCRVSTGALQNAPLVQQLSSAEDNEAARAWIQQFKGTPIPKAAVEQSFSRSSGPGGQNVNKVSTKATVRCSVQSSWIPAWVKAALRKHPAYAQSSGSIIVSSEVTRSQSQNLDQSLRKLHAIILAAAQQGVKNETSDETIERVKAHAHADAARRRKQKDVRSAIKQARRKVDF